MKFALRSLAKARGFTAVAVLTLALCIGANTAIFSAVYALMLKPLPFPAPDRLVEIYNTYVKGGVPRASSNPVQYLDYGKNAVSYTHVALWSPFETMFGEDASAERMAGVRATAEIFDVLGLKPVIGRFFTTENQLPAADKVVVLTQSFWEAHYREDPGVLNQTMRLDGETFTIVGVAPRALEAFNAARVRVIRPMSWDPASVTPQGRHGNNPRLFARMKPGVAIGAAQAEADIIEKRDYEAAPPPLRQFLDRAGHRIVVGSVQLERVQPLRTSLYLLQGGVVLVLLIGCVNVANLLLSRANARQSELAIRLALGASRGVIARQLLLESLVLMVTGAALGLALAAGITHAFNLYRAEMMPNALPFALDGGVLAFTAAVALVAGLLIGLAPVAHVLRANLMGLISRSTRSASGGVGVRTLSSILIVGQVAVAVMLLSGAGLLIRGFMRAVAVQPGFDPQGVITGRIAIPRAHRANADASRAVQERIQQAMREIPGVAAVALSLSTPFQGGLPLNAFTLAEDTLPPGSPQPAASRVIASPDYLSTLRLTLIEGRFFEPRDLAPNTRVFVVDENFAKKYFPGRSAVGGRFSFGGRPQNDADWPTVIGVVRPVPHRGVYDTSGVPFVYQPMTGQFGGVTVFLRTTRPATDTIAAMREKLRGIDPAIALFDTGPMQAAIDSSHTERRAVMLLLVGFAGVALFLSALGIYGVLAYDVSQRTREIGVRGAIGASHGQIIGLIMRQGLWKTGLGLVLGLVGAVTLSGYLKTLLFDVSATDPRAYAAISVLLLAVAAFACWLPARRATKVNPMVALRAE
jgi:putative ABC transport system permease protein